jgi:hypothetical protein
MSYIKNLFITLLLAGLTMSIFVGCKPLTSDDVVTAVKNNQAPTDSAMWLASSYAVDENGDGKKDADDYFAWLQSQKVQSDVASSWFSSLAPSLKLTQSNITFTLNDYSISYANDRSGSYYYIQDVRYIANSVTATQVNAIVSKLETAGLSPMRDDSSTSNVYLQIWVPNTYQNPGNNVEIDYSNGTVSNWFSISEDIDLGQNPIDWKSAPTWTRGTGTANVNLSVQ